MAKKKYYDSKMGYMSKAEKVGAGMMPSGAGMFANMPTASFMKAFPMNAYMTTSSYPDKLRDIDKQMNSDVMKAKRMASKTKF